MNPALAPHPIPALEPVVSSHLKAMGYDAHRREIWIDFGGDALYAYQAGAETLGLWLGLKASISKGKFLAQSIKPRCKYRRIPLGDISQAPRAALKE